MQISGLGLWIGIGLILCSFSGESVDGAVARNVDKAQAETIAAAAEAAAAEADDLAAAIEISEGEDSQGSQGGSSQYRKTGNSNRVSTFDGGSGSYRGANSGANKKFGQQSGQYGDNSDDDSSGFSDVETPLHTLLTDSSDLAKEVRTLFDVLSRRENYLVQEMEKLRDALQNAIDALSANKRKYRKY